MPDSKPEKRTVTYRLPVDLLRRVEEDAIAEGRQRASGRVYNPGAIVERIIREHYAQRDRRKQRL